MPKVISANYRDRKSPYKWLIRDANQSAADARACRRIEASGVKFTETGETESEYGCTVAAIAEDATGFQFEDDPSVGLNEHSPRLISEDFRVLKFNGDSFYDLETYDDIDNQKIKSLILTEAGRSLAIVD